MCQPAYAVIEPEAAFRSAALYHFTLTFRGEWAIDPAMTPLTGFDRLAGSIAGAGASGLWITPDGIDKMPNFKGAYVLALRLAETVSIGLPGSVAGQLTPGWYLYAGSARGTGGIRARVRRHFQHHKPLHWHIDWLTVRSVEMAALAVADGDECDLVDKLLGGDCFDTALAGFGSTDCRRCMSHLLAKTASIGNRYTPPPCGDFDQFR